MPRYVGNILIFAQSEVEAATVAEAREHFERAFGTQDAPKELLVSIDETNSAPSRLINVDPTVGMIGMRTEAAT
jgi:hypothetical protein